MKQQRRSIRGCNHQDLQRKSHVGPTSLLFYLILSQRQHNSAEAFITQFSIDSLLSIEHLSPSLRRRLTVTVLPPPCSRTLTSSTTRYGNIDIDDDLDYSVTNEFGTITEDALLNNIGGDIDSIGLDDFENVTEEDALLACRAYLQRKNRLGWTEYKKRKKLASRSLALASPLLEQSAVGMDSNSSMATNRNVGVGYFWENPMELEYLRKSQEDEDDMDGFYDGRDEEEDDELEMSDDDNRLFLSFPMFPSDERKRRSESKIKLFQNAEFKARWYKKRWGSATNNKLMSRQRKDKKRKMKLVENVPWEILDSPEMAALTNEEIKDAILTYKRANRKRSNKWEKTKEEARDARAQRSLKFQREGEGAASIKESKENDQELSPLQGSQNQFSSFSLSPDKIQRQSLRKAQLKRSRKAVKAYRTRRENMAKDILSRPSDVSVEYSNQSMPHKFADALDRIKTSIKSDEYPSLSDVEQVMKPSRLTGRKEVLIDILVKCFKMKGKCIPKLVSSDGIIIVDNTVLEFATQSKVRDIGAFVICKLKENSAKNSSQSPSCRSTGFSSNPYLHSIKASIESDEYPSISDIEQVMKPIRLAGRKEVLIDVLVKCFKMKGKCVPRKVLSNECENNGNYVLEVARRSTVKEIAEYVTYKLEERLLLNRDGTTMERLTSPSGELSTVSPSCISEDFSSNLFLNNIRRSIDSDKYPSISDIEQVMKPIRLAGRKELLIDVLVKCFRMRGKCVPRKVLADGCENDDTYVLEDTRKSTVQDIGSFVVHKLQEKLVLDEENSARNGLISSSSSAQYSDKLPPYDAHSSYHLVLDRIKASIESDEYPPVSDVEQVMKPERLAGRKEVLIDILVKCFKMKGKCVPKLVSSDGIINNDNSVLEFLTKSKVHEIGEFVISKLQDKREDIGKSASIS